MQHIQLVAAATAVRYFTLQIRSYISWTLLYILVDPPTGTGTAVPSSSLQLKNFVLQIFSAALLLISSKNDQLSSILYLLNPVSILVSTCASNAQTSALHLALFTFLEACEESQPYIMLLVLVALLAISSSFCALLPIAFIAITNLYIPKLGPVTTLAFLLLYICAVITLQTNHIYWEQLQTPDKLPGEYYPSLGIFWYLDAQVFPQLKQYFTRLIFFQPPIISLLLCTCCTVPIAILARLVIAVILLYSSGSTPYHTVFIVAMFLSRRDLAAQMKKWPWIVFGLAIALALSPILLKNWVELGTMNANFLFFTGLFFWLVLAMMIVDFTSVALGVSKNVESAPSH